MTWFNRKAIIIPAIAIALSVPFVSCNDEDTAHDDSTEAEHNATHLPGHEKSGDYNITPTLNTGVATQNEAQPVSTIDTTHAATQRAVGSSH